MPPPTKIHLHRRTQVLDVHFGAELFALPAEYLRVYSRSAEVVGHGATESKLEVGKQKVQILALTPQGNYGVKISFSDGHDTGIYTWDYLHELGTNYETWWNEYLDRLHRAGKSRNPEVSIVQILGPSG